MSGTTGMTSGQAKLAVAAVFLAGVVTGVAAMRLAQLRAEAMFLRSPDPLMSVVIARMGRDLRLTDRQRVEVREAMRESRREVFEATRDAFPKFLSIYDQTVARISKSLDDRQRLRFEELAGKRRKLLETLIASAGRGPGK